MERQLNKEQIDLLDEWIEKVTGTHHFMTPSSHLLREDVPFDLMDKLEKINWSEALYQNIEQYLSDKAMEIIYG